MLLGIQDVMLRSEIERRPRAVDVPEAARPRALRRRPERSAVGEQIEDARPLELGGPEVSAEPAEVQERAALLAPVGSDCAGLAVFQELDTLGHATVQRPRARGLVVSPRARLPEEAPARGPLPKGPA